MSLTASLSPMQFSDCNTTSGTTGSLQTLAAKDGFVSQIGYPAFFPLLQTDLAYWLSDGYTKSDVRVEYGDTDPDLCDLTIEVPLHQRLAQQFHTVHFGFDATPAVISAPTSPKRPAQISLCIDRIVTRNCSVTRRPPGFGILARRDHRMGMGTFSPSRFHKRSTRLSFTCQPASLSKAATRR